MKKIKIILALFSCFLIIVSCSSDDNPDTTESNNPELVAKIQGKWLLEGLTVNAGEFEEWPTGDVYYEFKSGGALTISYPGGSDQGTYQVLNNSITIRAQGGTQTFNISHVTDTSFRLSGQADADEEPGIDNVVFYLKKV